MTVYVEIVIFNNFFIDLLLGISTCFSRRHKLKPLRLVTSSIIGTIIGVLYLFMPPVAQVITKILLAPILVLVVDKYSSIKDYSVSLALFIIYTFLLGGCVYGISNLVGIDIRSYGVLGVLAMSVAILEAVLWFVVSRKSSYTKQFYDVSLSYKGNIFWMKGFYDSGNTLTDILTGKPIVLLSKSASDMINNNAKVTYEGFVAVKTINGESNLPIIELDEVRCGKSAYHCFAAFMDHEIENCDLILQNTLTYK